MVCSPRLNQHLSLFLRVRWQLKMLLLGDLGPVTRPFSQFSGWALVALSRPFSLVVRQWQHHQRQSHNLECHHLQMLILIYHIVHPHKWLSTFLLYRIMAKNSHAFVEEDWESKLILFSNSGSFLVIMNFAPFNSLKGYPLIRHFIRIFLAL